MKQPKLGYLIVALIFFALGIMLEHKHLVPVWAHVALVITGVLATELLLFFQKYRNRDKKKVLFENISRLLAEYETSVTHETASCTVAFLSTYKAETTMRKYSYDGEKFIETEI